LALVIDVTGIFGDMIESIWKRHAGIKDSGKIIPGHGGMLDRFDSAVAAIPAALCYLVIFGLL
ncbi:MAG: phosphatidate cytidylyltransferase, partial [Bacteroidales bacterium]|nr:phosphatidate cytidylyltransferase [Bacteroidales bacterium]